MVSGVGVTKMNKALSLLSRNLQSYQGRQTQGRSLSKSMLREMINPLGSYGKHREVIEAGEGKDGLLQK